MIRFVNGQFVLFTKQVVYNKRTHKYEHKVLGRHPTYERALRQERAIHIRKGG